MTLKQKQDADRPWLRQELLVVTKRLASLLESINLSEKDKRLRALVHHIIVRESEDSARTKAALESAKRRGTKLGNPNFTASLGRARECRRVQSHQRMGDLVPVVRELQRSGLKSLKDLAGGLNRRGFKTSMGCEFTPTHVHRILKFAQ